MDLNSSPKMYFIYSILLDLSIFKVIYIFSLLLLLLLNMYI